MEMGDRIKFLRRQKGITQEELGQIVGVQKAAVQKWESGTIPFKGTKTFIFDLKENLFF